MQSIIPEANPDLLTVPEAACHLRVVPATIRKWKHQGRFASRKHGGRVLFLRSDLDAFSNAGEERPAKAAKRR
jgi:excisionase family DNA binding protein